VPLALAWQTKVSRNARRQSSSKRESLQQLWYALCRFAKLASPPGLAAPLFPSVALDVFDGHPVSAM